MASAEDRAWFDGVVVATLSFGALCMLYVQLTQVFISRPTRGKNFWALVIYSSLLFPLAAIAMGGNLRFAELSYVVQQSLDPQKYIAAHGADRIHIMSQICVALVAWFGDVLILYRIYVFWNGRKWIMVLPSLLYIARVAMSIPLLISQVRPEDPVWATKTDLYAIVFYSLCVSLNMFASVVITAKLICKRQLAEQVMGRVHASFYTGWSTIIVESGGFFTLWGLVYVILLSRHNHLKDTFLLPYTQVLSITRMLIVLRMAQDRAWSLELARTLERGRIEPDWQVASTHSIPLHDVPASTTSSFPSKCRDDLSV